MIQSKLSWNEIQYVQYTQNSYTVKDTHSQLH